MQRENLEQKWQATIQNLNIEGLQLIDKLMGGISEMEEYNINTTEERKAEIKQEREARAARQEEERRANAEKEYFARMRKNIAEREAKIASLTGRERIFWDKIMKVKKMGIDKYCMKYWQTVLIADLFNNNYINASYNEFCYGFYRVCSI